MSRRLGTYMMLVLSALLIVVGLKLVIGIDRALERRIGGQQDLPGSAGNVR